MTTPNFNSDACVVSPVFCFILVTPLLITEFIYYFRDPNKVGENTLYQWSIIWWSSFLWNCKKYRQNLDNPVLPLDNKDINEQILEWIKEVKKISTLDEAQYFLKKWYQHDDLFSNNFEQFMLVFIWKLVERV